MEASIQDAMRLLSSCTLFHDLDEGELTELAARAVWRRYAAGQPIFHAGDPGESMMGIASGTVRIARTTAQGNEITLADFAEGDVFGEIAVLDGRGRSANARAVTNCRLLSLSRADLLAFLGAKPKLAASIIQLLCAKLRSADDRSSDLIFLSLGARLAKAILARATVSAAHPGGRVSFTQSELATMIGATRPNVNRQLKAWEQTGMVLMNRGWITVTDRPALVAETAV